MGRKGTRGYDRRRLLAAAREAAKRKRFTTALRYYRRVLAAEPDNVELHGLMAPLLARTRNTFDAWLSFRKVALHEIRSGHLERAGRVYSEASQKLPRNPAVWREWAELLRRSGRDAEAVDVLCRGARGFQRRRAWPEAIHLVRLARGIDPWRPETVLGLCRLLRRARQSEEAHLLLQELPRHVRASDRLRVLRDSFVLWPSFGSFSAWLGERFGPRRRSAGFSR